MMTQPNPLSSSRFSYLFIDVHDLRRMVDFYHEVLGMQVLYMQEDRFAFLSYEGGPQIALYPGRTSAISGESHWFIVFDVEDIERMVSVLRESVVEVSELYDVPFGRALMLNDPEGNRIQLHEPERS